MKKPLLLILTIIFLANTIIVSAWGQPCSMNNVFGVEQNTDMATDEMDMPCHDQNDQSQNTNTQDCDGLCQCLNASIFHHFIIDNALNINQPIAFTERLISKNEIVLSRVIPPLFRPPITIA